jgi:protein involved in polysaccharide export with SLBB domain
VQKNKDKNISYMEVFKKKIISLKNKFSFSVLVLLMVSNFTFGQFQIPNQVPQTQYPQQNQQLPQTTETETTLPKESKTKTNNRKDPIVRQPTKGATDTRDIKISAAETAAIASEEKQRLEKEAEIAEDLVKSKLIKRTFGSSIFSNTKVDLGAQSNIGTPNNYVLGPGDKINVDIYGYSQYKQSSLVNSDGFVVFEKAGIVPVSGLTLEMAENKIKNAYSKIFIGLNSGNGYPANTFLKVSLTGLRIIKVKITGEVVAPGTYTMTSFTTLLNAMYSCGGPNEIGTYRDIKLIRNNKILGTLDLYDIVTKGYSNTDFLLKDQDVVYVGPFVSRIAIDGFTKRKGLFELTNNERLSDALNYAGGFDQNAYSDLVKIYRNTSKEKRILDIKSADFKNTPVQTGDSIVIEKVLDRFENMVEIEGAVFRPGRYSLNYNPTLLALIKSAEGLKEESLQGNVSITRTNEDLSVSNISVNLDDVRTGRSSDQKLQRLDRVTVASNFDLTEVSYIKIQGAINNVDALKGVQIPYVRNMTIKELLIRVGGLTEAASLSKIEIVRRKRNVDPKQIDAQISEIIPIELGNDLNANSLVDKNILMPFDEVFVRSSPNYEKQNFISISGEVIYPGKYGIKFKDEKISDVISRAGGVSPLSYLKGATLVRKTLLTDFQKTQREEVLNNLNLNAKVKKVIVKEETDAITQPLTDEEKKLANQITESVGIDLEKILLNPGSSEDLILNDGDEIMIPKRLQTIRVEGEVLYPTTVKYLPTLTFIDYVSRSGGFTKKSAAGKAFIIYPNGSVDRTRKFLFVKIYPKVEPGSEIIVPGKTENSTAQLNRVSAVVQTIGYTLTGLVSIFGLLQLNKNK